MRAGRVVMALVLATALPAGGLRAQGLPGLPALPDRPIVVVCDDDYPPYSFRDREGTLQGIVTDAWRAWERQTGVPVTILGMDWADALSTMRSGGADVIDTIFRTDERDGWLDFTPSWARLDVPVFFHSDISGIASPRDLRGFRVAVKEGDACVDVLRSHGVEDFEFYSSYDAIVEAAAGGSEKVFCMDEPPALYLLGKANAGARFKKALNLYTGWFHRAVAKGNTQLLDLVNAGFRDLGRDELRDIHERWFGTAVGLGVDPRLPWALGILAAVAALVAANLGMAAAFLRRRVAVRTAELAEKISQLTESETRLHAIVDALPDMMFVFDADARFIELLAGATARPTLPPGEYLGRTVAEVFGDEALQRQAVEAIRTAMDGHGVETLLYRMDFRGVRREFESRLVALGPNRVLCIDRDVTERETAAATLAASLKEKEALLREIHHRVKNNLQIVSSLLALQAERFKDPWDTMLFMESQSRVRAMAQVHEQLYRSGDFASIPAKDYLEDLVGELLSAYGTGHAPGLPSATVAVRSDGSELELELAVPVGLIVNELATNAFKYGLRPDGSGEVSVSVSTDAEGRLSVRVADQGEGFPPGRDPLGAGGMGYTIVLALVQQLGAEIRTGTGDGGRGASVEIVVPSARLPAARVPPASQPPAEGGGSAAQP